MRTDQIEAISLEDNSIIKGYPVLIVLTILTIAASIITMGYFGYLTSGLIFLGTILTVILLFLPRVCFYLFFLSIALFLPYRLAGFAIHPFDVCLALAIGSIFIDFILNINYKIRPTNFDANFLFIIGATFLSALFAYNPSYSIVPVFRIITIYIAFRIFFKFFLTIGVEKIIKLYILMVTLLSIHNSITYLYFLGEERVFGLPWLTYETFAMTSIPMALAFLIWADNNRQRLFYAFSCLITIFGIIATQSRAPLVTLIIAIPVLLYVSLKKSQADKGKQFNFKLKYIIVPSILLLGLVIIFRESIFAGVWERYESFLLTTTDTEGSIILRFLLWSAAWKAFLLDPITGIGIGNFKLIIELIPEIQVSRLWARVANMSAHNVFLQYLAETGIIGATALVALAWNGLKTATLYRTIGKNKTDIKISMAIYISMFIFFITIFYTRDWTWGQGGYLLAFFFGLTAAWRFKQEHISPQ